MGFRWQTTDDLQKLSENVLLVRYVDRHIVLVEGFSKEEEANPVFVDQKDEDEQYYLTDHPCEPPPLGAVVVYSSDGLRGWSLLRMTPMRAAQLRERGGQFLWALPGRYNVQSWLGKQSYAKAVQQESADVVRGLLEGIDTDRLKRDVEALALIDPQAGSVPGNYRSRFVLHPDMREATEYIRSEFAAALGDQAVDLREFPISKSTARSRVRENKEGIDKVDSTAFNVVATLPGSDPNAGYYVLCAHYDATAVRSVGWNWREDPAPGADDNASGVALVLESARALAGQTFPWTIKFIAFSGEELGLFGSRAYAEEALLNNDRILGVFNFDMIGFNDLSERLELVSNPGSLWLVEAMRSVNGLYDIGLQVDVLEDAGAGLSDHAPFWARGYDAILGIENYLPTDTTTVGVRRGDYRINAQYHSMVDLPDSLNYGLIQRVTRLAVATLAQYGVGVGKPNLAVYSGDLRGDSEDNLRVRVGNAGFGALTESFAVRVSQCQLDSTDCKSVYETRVAGGLVSGGGTEVSFPWGRFGEQLFLVEVEASEDEVTLEDNRAFQYVRLTPQRDVVVYPNPFQFNPEDSAKMSFLGVPTYGEVRIYTVTGELVWLARENAPDQRRLGSRDNQVIWLGSSGSVEFDRYSYYVNNYVNSGIYVYTVHFKDGTLFRKGKVAVVRAD